MKLWKGNRLDCEYEATEEEIVDGFLDSHYYYNWLNGNAKGSLDLTLRFYISSPDGLGSTFEDDDYKKLLKMVEDRPHTTWKRPLSEHEAEFEAKNKVNP